MITGLKEKFDDLLFTRGVQGLSQEGSLVIKAVDLIIFQALEERASDIHVEPMKEGLRIRYRIDGILYEVLRITKDALPIIPRLKIMAELDPDVGRSHTPQDGRFSLQVGSREVDVRVSTFPTILGEKIAMRLLEKETTFLKLEQLGFSPAIQQRYEAMIQRPNGMIFVTGPTNSGKTSTLYATLAALNAPQKNIITLEDPVEYQIKGISQGQVNSKVGLTFAAGLRSILRQDPNIIMVGEIRDVETAEIAIRASLTGHLVFSTLHTNDAVGAVVRLLDMGIEPFLIASSMIGVVAQRLVRKICPSCKVADKPLAQAAVLQTPEEAQEKRPDEFYIVGEEKEAPKPKPRQVQQSEPIFYKGKGCKACYQIGYRGRIGIFELLEATEEIGHLILKKSPTGALRAVALRSGMKTMRDDGFEKAKAGITAVEEILRVTRET